MTTSQKLSDEKIAALAARFDHHGPEYREHSAEILEHMQRHCPFVHSEAWGGFWVATTGEHVLEIAKKAEVFSSAQGETIPDGTDTRMIPLHSDPPELYDYRAILNPLFAPKKMAEWAQVVRDEANALMDKLVARGGGDLVMDVGQPLTAITTLKMTGFNPDDWYKYAHPLHELVYSAVPREEKLAMMSEMEREMNAEIARLRSDPPPGSILEYLFDVDMAGRKLRMDEIQSMVLIIFGGGFDTAQALMGRIGVFLGHNPEYLRDLNENRHLIDNAIEEFLRVFPPTQGNSRCAVKPVTIAGQHIAAGEHVFMSWAAANRDPAEYDDPHKIDFRRELIRHYSFGVGPHRCLGSHLARLEVKAFLEALLDKAPDFRLVESEIELADDIGTVAGYNKVGIVL